MKVSSTFRIAPFWASLTGPNEKGADEIAKVVKKQTGHSSVENQQLDATLATFGGLPRFYELAVNHLRDTKAALRRISRMSSMPMF